MAVTVNPITKIVGNTLTITTGVMNTSEVSAGFGVRSRAGIAPNDLRYVSLVDSKTLAPGSEASFTNTISIANLDVPSPWDLVVDVVNPANVTEIYDSIIANDVIIVNPITPAGYGLRREGTSYSSSTKVTSQVTGTVCSGSVWVRVGGLAAQNYFSVGNVGGSGVIKRVEAGIIQGMIGIRGSTGWEVVGGATPKIIIPGQWYKINFTYDMAYNLARIDVLNQNGSVFGSVTNIIGLSGGSTYMDAFTVSMGGNSENTTADMDDINFVLGTKPWVSHNFDDGIKPIDWYLQSPFVVVAAAQRPL